MRRLLIILGIVVLVLVAADRIVKVIAEREAEQRIQETYGLVERPNVTVRGFPFLTQVIRRELRRVDLAVDNLVVGAAESLDVDVTARGVKLLSGYEGRAETVAGSLVLPYDDIERLAMAAGTAPLDVGYGGEPGLVEIRASVDLPTGPIEVVAFSEVQLDGAELTVRLARLEVDGAPAPAAVRDILGDQLDFAITLPDVPGASDVTIDSVQAGPDGVVVTMSGRDIAVG